MNQLDRLSEGLVLLSQRRDSFLEEGNEEEARIAEEQMMKIGTEIRRIQRTNIPISSKEEAEDSLNNLDIDISISKDIPQVQISGQAGVTPTMPGIKLPNYKEAYKVLNEKLPEYLGVSKNDINLQQSLGSFERLGLGFATDEDQARTLVARYGADNVRYVPINNKLRPMIRDKEKTNNKFIFVDKIGLDAKDVFDLGGGATEMVPEIALAAYAPYIKVAKAYPITKSAIGALTGRTGGSLARDALAAASTEADFNLAKSAGQAITEGTEAAIYDFAFGQAIRVGGKIVGGEGPLKVSKDTDLGPIQDSINQLEKTFNVKFPRTPGLLSPTTEGLEKELTNIAKYSNGVIKTISKRAEKARDTLYEIAARVQGQPNASYADEFSKWAKEYSESYSKLIDEIAEQDQVVAAQYKRALDDRMSDMGFGKQIDQEGLAGGIRSGVETTVNSLKQQSHRLHEDYLIMADKMGINADPKDVTARLNKTINSLNLPKELNGQIKRLFLPSKVRLIEDQAKSLTKKAKPSLILDANGRVIPPKDAVEPNVQNLSLRQIENWRKDVYDFYLDAVQNKPREAAKIKKIYNEFESILDDIAARGGDELIQARSVAKQFFKDNLLTPQNPSIKKMLSKNPDKSYTLSDRQLIGSFYQGAKAVDNIKDLKKVMGANSQAVQDIKDGYINYAIDTSTGIDGAVDYLKIKIRYDKDIVKELYGSEGVRKFKELDRLFQFSKTSKIKPSQFQKLMDASPKDVKGVLKEIQTQQFKEVAKQNIVKNRLLKKVAEGEKINFSTPIEFLEEFKTLTAAESKKVLDAMPKELRSSFRQEFVADIYSQAGRDSGKESIQRTSRALNREAIWDVSTMDNFLKDKKWRERAEAVVGKNTIRQISQVNQALKAYQKKSLSDAELKINTIASPDPKKSTNFYGSGLIPYVYHRLFAAAHTSGSFAKVFSNTKDVPKALNLLLPTMLSTKEGLTALSIEAEKDPRFKNWLMENAPNVLGK